MKILAKQFYNHATDVVAKKLLGKFLVRNIHDQLLIGMIVETEAYGYPDDPAGHAYIGLTKRNSALFGPVGRAYIYKSYGIHTCFDIVGYKQSAQAGGILIRAVEPIQGIELMQKFRGVTNEIQVTSGPGNVCKAFHITLHDNHKDLTESTSDITIVQGISIKKDAVMNSARVGISKARHLLWRFYIKGNKWVTNHPKY